MTEHELTILKLYTILDKKSNRFLPPFFSSNDDEAKRIIGQEVNYKPGLINSYPEDYDLFFVGTFDTYNGYLDRDEQVMYLICNLKDLKKDDTLKYDELLKQVKTQQGQVDVSVMRFQQAMMDFETTFNGFIENCKSKFDDKIISYEHVVDESLSSKVQKEVTKQVNLYVPVVSVDSKKSFLEKLFN